MLIRLFILSVGVPMPFAGGIILFFRRGGLGFGGKCSIFAVAAETPVNRSCLRLAGLADVFAVKRRMRIVNMGRGGGGQNGVCKDSCLLRAGRYAIDFRVRAPRS
jgi:hypothetical protein